VGVIVAMRPRQHRPAVKKSQHLAESPCFHFSDGIDGLCDLINPNVFDPLWNQSLVEDLETTPFL
jgi:hypothetical protein